MCRRCGERDRRGKARDRRARKRWLLKEFGDGKTVECFWGCGTKLTFATLQQDRIVPGGPYRKDNVVPSCADCNIKRAAETIPDGCHYGPVGDLATDRHGRYLDEPSLAAPDRKSAGSDADASGSAATATIPRPRTGAADGPSLGAAGMATADHEGPTMPFPRPHRSVPRTVPAPAHQRQPALVSAVALAEHARHERIPADDVEPDLVVIDTSNIEELRARHPWLFTEQAAASDDGQAHADGQPRLQRIDAELDTAAQALNHAEADEHTSAQIDPVVDEREADLDTGWGR